MFNLSKQWSYINSVYIEKYIIDIKRQAYAGFDEGEDDNI